MRAIEYKAQRPRAALRRRQGSAIVEFALVGSFIFLPLLAGLVSVGVSLVSAIQVANLNANAGQMFAAGTDFTNAANQAILWRVGGSLDMADYGKVILSEIDVAPDFSLSCPNPITIGTGPGASQYVAGGAVLPAFSDLIQTGGYTLASGQRFYLAETFYTNPALTWVFAPATTSKGIYMKAVF